MSTSVVTGSHVNDADSNITEFETWDAALAYAGQLTEGGPVTVKVSDDPTAYRITADGRKRALCHTHQKN